jgi:hypothetical protein
MNLRTQFFILGCILFLIIVVSLTASSDPVPYSETTLFTKQFPYEGFDMPSPDIMTGTLGHQDTPSNKPKNENMAVKTEGFESLTPSPNNVNDSSIDIYSQLSSGKGCKPSPYSNSQGYLCLDPNASSMLSTRGGNATGQPDSLNK